MSARGRVLIIGGSMAGLFAAIGLRNRGFDVAVFERAGEALINRGAGIATHDELYDALRTAGVELRDEMGVESRGRIMFDAGGNEIGRHDMPQVMTSWGLIYRFVREQIPADIYHPNHALADITEHASGITARFENGVSAEGDWLIGADGARSTVRGLVVADHAANYAGYLGWRGLIDETLISDTVLRQFDQRMALGMAPGGHWLGYLVAGPGDALEPGRRWYNWGWYRTADADKLTDTLTDSDGTIYPNGIPHDRLRAEVVDAMRSEAEQYLAPQIQSVIDATQQPFIQGMYDQCCERFVHGRSILIGDAACTARPHVGLGVSKAADDAASLAVALAADDQRGALSAWDEERSTYAARVLDWSRRLGSYIGPQPDDPEHRRLAEYHMRPEVLMTQTAATNPAQYLAA